MKSISRFFLIVIFSSFTVIVQGQSTDNPFLINYAPKTIQAPAFKEMQKPSRNPDVIITVIATDTLAKVSTYLYGANSNPYIGNIDQEPKLIGYLKQLSPHIIRLPGGSLSDQFFWDASPGNLPAGVPDSIWDDNTGQWSHDYIWYGRNSWSFPIDGYYNMLRETNTEGIITVNVGYARYGKTDHPIQQAAHYAADWVRYDNGRTKYWEIGNENYGSWEAGYRINTSTNKDGQPEYINGELYGKIAKVYIDSMKAAAKEIDSQIYIGTQIYDQQPPSYDNIAVNWNSGYFKSAGDAADFYIEHNYFTEFNQNSTPDQIFNSVNSQFSSADNYYPKQIEALGAKAKPIAMTEWNIFAWGSKQRTSFINGMHATMVLGELAKRPKYGEASRWDIANSYDDGADMGMFKVEDSSQPPIGVPKWNPRPVFFYMYYFQKFFGDHSILTSVSGNDQIVTYASTFHSGQLGVVVVNKSTSGHTVEIKPDFFTVGSRYFLYSLTGGTDNPPFSLVVNVNGAGSDYSTGGPIHELDTLKAWSAYTENGIILDSPARSVQFILIDSDKQGTAIQPDNPSPNKPVEFKLNQNYPNPFNPTTQITYTLKNTTHVTIKVYNVLGQYVAKLVDGKETAGVHQIQWDGRNASGNIVGSGVYIYRMQTNQFTKSRKMIFMK